MNEKSFDALKKYDFRVNKYYRARGGMILDTDKGLKLFVEAVSSDKYYLRECEITKRLVNVGFNDVDTYYKNEDLGVLTVSKLDGKKYLVKNWFDAQECDVKNIEQILIAVSKMADMHKSLNQTMNIYENKDSGAQKCEKEYDINEMTLDSDILRHTRELKKAMNYIKNKKKRSDYEMLIYKNINIFYNQSIEAYKKISEEKMIEFINKSQKRELVHCEYNYHNIMIGNDKTYICNFDRVKRGNNIYDLYVFMRKILEKYNYNIEIGYKMLDEYNKYKAITEEELELIRCLFLFPEKFWKIINYYFNMNKAWIPPKNMEKLIVYLQQSEYRWEFLATICGV